MTDVTELELRISAALDRLENGIAAVKSGAGSDPAEAKALQEALDAERTANAQLEERVRAIKEKQETLVQSLEAETAQLRDELSRQEHEGARLLQVNAQLRENNRALREANAQGVGDPALINDAMVAELDALRVSRDSDRRELESILVELKPLVEGRISA